MKISYDPEVDAMYIQLIEGEHECRTVRLNDEIALDFGAREELVGIEILDAKMVIGKGRLPRLLIDDEAFSVISEVSGDVLAAQASESIRGKGRRLRRAG